MRLSIAALATAFALPAAAGTSPAPAGTARTDAPLVATKDGTKKPATQVARNDCKTPKKAKKPAREGSKG